jgi:hypothetical protein
MVEVVLEGGDGFARLLLPRGPVAHFLDSSDAFTHGELSEELLANDLEESLAEILAAEENQDPFGE